MNSHGINDQSSHIGETCCLTAELINHAIGEKLGELRDENPTLDSKNPFSGGEAKKNLRSQTTVRRFREEIEEKTRYYWSYWVNFSQ